MGKNPLMRWIIERERQRAKIDFPNFFFRRWRFLRFFPCKSFKKNEKKRIRGRTESRMTDGWKKRSGRSSMQRKNLIVIKINVAKYTPVCADYQFGIVSQSVLNRSINNMMLYQQFDFDARTPFSHSNSHTSSQLRYSQIQNKKNNNSHPNRTDTPIRFPFFSSI